MIALIPSCVVRICSTIANEKLDTLRHRLIHRAGRLTRPHGTLTLTMSANASARDDIERYIQALAA
jgi:hypothetical protein